MECFFTKTSTEREVAHLYEHIFLTALDKTLIDKGYLPFMDYLVNGESLSGEIEINFKSFSPTLTAKIEDILAEVDKNLRYTSDIVQGGLDQISAEKRLAVTFVNPDIVERMSSVRRRKWRKGVAVEIDFDGDPEESDYLRFAHDPELNFYNIPVEVGYKGRDIELGLFLSRIIMEILCRKMVNDYGCCFDEACDEIDEKHVSLASIMIRPDNAIVRKEMVAKMAQKLLADMKLPKNIIKLQRQLKKGPYIKISVDTISGKKTFKDVDWAKFANPLKIAKTLDKIEISPLEITLE